MINGHTRSQIKRDSVDTKLGQETGEGKHNYVLPHLYDGSNQASWPPPGGGGSQPLKYYPTWVIETRGRLDGENWSLAQKIIKNKNN